MTYYIYKNFNFTGQFDNITFPFLYAIAPSWWRMREAQTVLVNQLRKQQASDLWKQLDNDHMLGQ